MYAVFVLLIAPFVWWHSRYRYRHGFLSSVFIEKFIQRPQWFLRKKIPTLVKFGIAFVAYKSFTLTFNRKKMIAVIYQWRT